MNDVVHSGIVEKIKDDYYIVKITSVSSCASCHAKDACPSSDKKEKHITINTKDCRELKIGENVDLFISTNNGKIAFVIAYTIPVILMILAIIILKLSEVSEAISALFILSTLTLYFIVLYTLRDKINKKIKIKVK